MTQFQVSLDDNIPSAPTMDDFMKDESEVDASDVITEASAPTFEDLRQELRTMEPQNVLDDVMEITPFTEVQLRGLYRNAELDRNSELVDEFLEVGFKDLERSPLHELLLNYLRVRSALIGTEKSLEALASEASEDQDRLWIFHPKKVSGEGVCQDKKTRHHVSRLQGLRL